MAPSPTADATRFIESSRTSPAAKTPGTLVSSANGVRDASGQADARRRHQLRAGDDEAVLVAEHGVAEPVRAR